MAMEVVRLERATSCGTRCRSSVGWRFGARFPQALSCALALLLTEASAARRIVRHVSNYWTLAVSASIGTVESLDAVFRALASAQRREILAMLSECTPGDEKTCGSPNEVCACKISERLGLKAPTISHHMAILRDAGLVTARKEGLWVYYSLRRDALAAVARDLAAL